VCGDVGGSFASFDVLRPLYVECMDCVGAVFVVVFKEHVSNAATGSRDHDRGHGGDIVGERLRFAGGSLSFEEVL